MSAASLSTNLTKEDTRRSEIQLRCPGHAARSSTTSVEDHACTSLPRIGSERYYTSLQDYTEAVLRDPITPGGGGGSTPRADERREGFTWEPRKSEGPTPFARLPPTPNTPPLMEEIMRSARTEDTPRERLPSLARDDSTTSRASTDRLSSAPSLSGTISRSDTNLSDGSSLSGLARGTTRHVPDMRMFLPVKKVSNADESSGTRASHKKSKAIDPARSIVDKEIHIQDPVPVRKPEASIASPAKSGLLNRRKLAQGEAMKLTLPPNMPELPSRTRMPMTELNSLFPSRPRSLKTPAIHDRLLEWHTGVPLSAPATIMEELDPASGLLRESDPIDSRISQLGETIDRNFRAHAKLRFGRTKSGTRQSDSPPQQSPILTQDNSVSILPTQQQSPRTQEELRDLGKQNRARRWRWSTQRSSNDVSPDAADTPAPPFSLTRLVRPKIQTRHSSTSIPKSHKSGNSFWRRKQVPPPQLNPGLEAIANMPVPTNFIPPGMTRVPTPPMFDANGEVKGKLADFFFEMQGGAERPNKSPASVHGIWDSDALLMSQVSDIAASGDSESPEGPLGGAPVMNEAPLHSAATTTPSDAVHVHTPRSPVSPMHPSTPSGNDSWFRITSSDTPPESSTRGADEFAKLEWLVPEHLPSSPLCPLHAKYRGPARGFCVFHSRRQTSALPGAKAATLAASRRASVGLGRETDIVLDGELDGLGRSRWRRLAGASSP